MNNLIYICHFNYDYREWTTAHTTREDAVGAIRDAFDIHVEEDGFDTPDFWDRVMFFYETSNWKGFTFQTLNPKTLEIREVVTG